MSGWRWGLSEHRFYHSYFKGRRHIARGERGIMILSKGSPNIGKNSITTMAGKGSDKDDVGLDGCTVMENYVSTCKCVCIFSRDCMSAYICMYCILACETFAYMLSICFQTTLYTSFCLHSCSHIKPAQSGLPPSTNWGCDQRGRAKTNERWSRSTDIQMSQWQSKRHCVFSHSALSRCLTIGRAFPWFLSDQATRRSASCWNTCILCR